MYTCSRSWIAMCMASSLPLITSRLISINSVIQSITDCLLFKRTIFKIKYNASELHYFLFTLKQSVTLMNYTIFHLHGKKIIQKSFKCVCMNNFDFFCGIKVVLSVPEVTVDVIVEDLIYNPDSLPKRI